MPKARADAGDIAANLAVADDAQREPRKFHERKIPVAEIRARAPTPVGDGLA